MKTRSKPSPRERAVLVSCLAAKVLGRSRAAGTENFTPRDLTRDFPDFNELEMACALSELVDRHLITQKGREEKAIYALTDSGRTGRVGIA